MSTTRAAAATASMTSATGTVGPTDTAVALPRVVDPAPRRDRLRVVPRRRVRTPRVPFVMLVSVVLVTGVMGLLCFNTQMQQASFTTSTLEQRAATLGARQQTLEQETAELRSPNRVNAAAVRAGLVIPDVPAQLSLVTGKVTGDPQPATRAATPPLNGRSPGKPAAINPAPTVVVAQPAAPVVDPAAAAAAAQAAATAAATAATAKPARTKQAGTKPGKKQGRAGARRSAGRR